MAALRDVSVAQVERELARLRAPDDGAPHLRTSVMTHMAWVPEEWLAAARATLAGLGERHPSRTIVLVPEPGAGEDAIDARLALEDFAVGGRHVCSEVIELRLRGRRAQVPASIVVPLLVADLPVFLRWRGLPPFGEPELEQLAGVTDRLIVDSREWPDPAAGFRALAGYLARTAVSDIAWGRTLPWRRALAALWPGIADVSELRVAGPAAEALLLCGWLRARLGRAVALSGVERDEVERVDVDGQAVVAPALELRTPSDLLSDELDRLDRDPVYEAALQAAPSQRCLAPGS